MEREERDRALAGPDGGDAITLSRRYTSASSAEEGLAEPEPSDFAESPRKQQELDKVAELFAATAEVVRLGDEIESLSAEMAAVRAAD